MQKKKIFNYSYEIKIINQKTKRKNIRVSQVSFYDDEKKKKSVCLYLYMYLYVS